ncbi:MAG: hypothetical protein JWM32_2434 [Verrucomicrobia bacterium]|nr:hypothetical protein [Verrucomicrobiota bacterium]
MKNLLFALLALTVSRAAGAEAWSKVSAARFTIYTAGSASKAKELLGGTLAFHALVKSIGPAEDRLLDPATVVFFQNDTDFEKIFPAPPDKVMGNSITRQLQAGQVVQSYGRFLLAINLHRDELARTAFFLNSGTWASQGFPRTLPAWLFTGLREVAYNIVVRSDGVDLGARSKMNVETLGGKLPASFDDIVAAQSGAGVRGGMSNVQIFAGDWAVLHYLLWSENGAHRPELVRYVKEWEAGRTHAEAAAAAWPAGTAELSQRVNRYVKLGKFRGETIATSSLPAITMVAALPGEAEVGLGYICVFSKPDEAVRHFDAADRLSPNLSMVSDARGYQQLAQTHPEEATEFFKRSIQLGTDWAWPYLAVATDVANPVIGTEAVTDHLDGREAREATALLQRAVALQPRGPEFQLYALLIGALTEVTPDDARILAEGHALYPTSYALALGQAAYDLKAGNFKSARDRLAAAGNLAVDQRMIPYADRIASRLNAAENLADASGTYAEGRIDETRNALLKVPQAALSPAELLNFRVMNNSVTAFDEMCAAIDAKDFKAAEAAVAAVQLEKLPEKMNARFAELRTRLNGAMQVR